MYLLAYSLHGIVSVYVDNHPLCVEAYTEKGTISKTSILYAIKPLQSKAPVPESYREDVPMLEKAVELMDKISEYTSHVKGMSEALDKKCRDQYEKLTEEEIIDLLVNRKSRPLIRMPFPSWSARSRSRKPAR